MTHADFFASLVKRMDDRDPSLTECERHYVLEQLAKQDQRTLPDVALAMHGDVVRRYVRSQNRWFRYCRTGQLTRNGRIPANPSKAAKHRAYGSAAAIARHRGEVRPSTFPGLAAIVGLESPYVEDKPHVCSD